jgi:AcrR family transcriptional regulator
LSAASSRAAAAADKRRQILDAAIRVFATRGFHACRVSDVADEAGVAYGLVYHYFGSKEEILNTLFAERWQIMLDAIAEIDRRQEIPARDKLYLVASFIIDSYRHEPDLMKVIIVEVTRAANSFGREHLATSSSCSPPGSSTCSRRARMTSSRRSSWWSRRSAAVSRSRAPRRPRSPVRVPALMQNELVKRLVWSGLLAGLGAIATIATTRIATAIWVRLFDEDPPE